MVVRLTVPGPKATILAMPECLGQTGLLRLSETQDTRRGRWKRAVFASPSSWWVQGALSAVLLIPLLATCGQFLASGYWKSSTGFLILYWPGATGGWTLHGPVFLFFGGMALLYLGGIAWMASERTLGRATLWCIAAVIVANLLGAAVNKLTGWRELQTMASLNLAGKVNAALFSSWHNPVWESTVFQAIPFLCLRGFEKLRRRRSIPALAAYYLVPATVMALYHVPNHGPSRIADTFIICVALGWITLRFGVIAPYVLHIVLDAVIVLSVPQLPHIPPAENPWLLRYQHLLNTAWSLSLMAVVMSFLIAIVLAGRATSSPPAVLSAQPL